ncbi:uncharacterized protein LOC126755833 [Bactrocera neohumeralis]|uniref:uncharacterized protein LOC126755833 n=1 Tax=Bactrocera neohumeralis TaxID=98809 RepID=UPI00216543E3|nr:uncharacterized protein LOC126755833 [Bactrocera neohumeralis]
MKLGEVSLRKEEQRLYGIGKGELTTMDNFITEVTVQAVTVEVKCEVVKVQDISYAAMLGNDILKEVDLVFSNGRVGFRKPNTVREKCEDTGANELAVKSVGDETEISVSERVSAEQVCEDQVVPEVLGKEVGRECSQVGDETEISASERVSAEQVCEDQVVPEVLGKKVGRKCSQVGDETEISASERGSAEQMCGYKVSPEVPGKEVDAKEKDRVCRGKGFNDESESKFLGEKEKQLDNESDKVELSHLADFDAAFAKTLINKYQPQEPMNVPVQMKLILTNGRPEYQRPSRVSYEDQRYLDDQVGKVLKEGIILGSTSEYNGVVQHRSRTRMRHVHALSRVYCLLIEVEELNTQRDLISGNHLSECQIVDANCELRSRCGRKLDDMEGQNNNQQQMEKMEIVIRQQEKAIQGHSIRRLNSEYRVEEQGRNTTEHSTRRTNPEYRIAEQERDTIGHSIRRLNP